MTKEQFKIFVNKQKELYSKYADSKDKNAYDDMQKEWLEFIRELNTQNSSATEVYKRLPCELCEHYDSDTKKCDNGNNPEEDNDPLKGCWDFLP